MSSEDSLSRFGVSIPGDLLRQYDDSIQGQGYANRSEALRDLIRRSLIQTQSATESQTVAGTIVMVYDHHSSELPLTLIELQHDYHHDIISTMHVHLDHDQCMEIVVVRGSVQRLRELSDRIRVLRGVLYCELSVTHVDTTINKPSHHGHDHHHRSTPGNPA
jgi:CopG family transcriptional regulator, nickel-responsive regulator